MSGFLNDPPRLKERHDQSDLAERIAGQAFRDMSPAASLSATALARIAARVQERAPLPGPRRRLRWAFVCCALLLGIATAASAQHLGLLPRWFIRTLVPKPKLISHQRLAPTISRQGPAARRTDELPSAVVPTKAETSEVESSARARDPEPPTVHNKPVRPTGTDRRETRRIVPRQEQDSRLATSPPSTSVPPASESGWALPKSVPAAVPATGERDLRLALVEPKGKPTALTKTMAAANPIPEPTLPAMPPGAQQAAQYLGLAIRALRVEHSPKSALALLDRHSAELRHAFAHETLLLRVEAMLALRQQSQVLELLDGTSLFEFAASQSLLVMRGQLRATANRCSEAIGDFDRVLAGAGSPSQQALLGRALCKKRMGDTAGSQSDMQRYRREFPDAPAAP
jgi:hypothetical protein